jgi:hypothetical protein
MRAKAAIAMTAGLALAGCGGTNPEAAVDHNEVLSEVAMDFAGDIDSRGEGATLNVSLNACIQVDWIEEGYTAVVRSPAVYTAERDGASYSMVPLLVMVNEEVAVATQMARVIDESTGERLFTITGHDRVLAGPTSAYTAEGVRVQHNDQGLVWLEMTGDPTPINETVLVPNEFAAAAAEALCGIVPDETTAVIA